VGRSLWVLSSAPIAAELLDILLVAIAAFQLTQSVLVRLERKLGYGLAAFGASPVSFEHLTSVRIRCHFCFALPALVNQSGRFLTFLFRLGMARNSKAYCLHEVRLE